jgi:hypothetical protein
MLSSEDINKVSEKLTFEFLDYIKLRNHEIIKAAEHSRVNFLYQAMHGNMMRGNVFYYDNKVNHLEMFWEKKLFDYLLSHFEENCKKHNFQIEIWEINITSPIYDSNFIEEGELGYNLKRGMIVEYKNKRI